jgi:hypothetical protein
VFVVEGGIEIGGGLVSPLDLADEPIEASESIELFGVAKFGGIEGAAQDCQRLVVGFERNRERVAVLAAQSE